MSSRALGPVASHSYADHLAPWVDDLPLGAQITVTATLLELRLIQWRRPGAYDDLDKLLVEADPNEMRRLGEGYAARYGDSPGLDGRVGSLCAKLAETVEAFERTHPEASDND